MASFNLDFTNTKIAFESKSNNELLHTERLFKVMNNRLLVSTLTKLGNLAIKYNLPFSHQIVRNTIFNQFCGGESLEDCENTINKLYKYNTLTILDYGVEGKHAEMELNKAMNEFLKAIETATKFDSIPVVSIKFTGLINSMILQQLHEKKTLTEVENKKFENFKERVNVILTDAYKNNIGVFIDAEESWFQDPIDDLTMEMMCKFNKKKAIVYNTYQLYNKFRFQKLKEDHQKCLKEGVILGAKLVRGAYMDKERSRALKMGYESPIQNTKEDTDQAYDKALAYCVDNYESISFCCASHNTESNLLLARLVHEKNIAKNHPHVNFCQLYGMSDNLTFNLAHEGYNSSKYVVYGPIKDVVPYLVRRAEENTSVTGEMSRELSLITQEKIRRNIK